MGIEKQLDIKFPIYWNEWPIEEQFVKYLIYKIITKRPKQVVELGSGTSSLIILKTLNKLGYDYNLTSVDSDERFLQSTKNLLVSEGVFDEKFVKLIHAPIQDLQINGTKYRWYDINKIDINNKIDFLFIDGPVGNFCKNARYPALNILKEYLKEGSLVVMHDANREDELEIVEMWKKENNEIKTVYHIETERGGAELNF